MTFTILSSQNASLVGLVTKICQAIERDITPRNKREKCQLLQSILAWEVHVLVNIMTYVKSTVDISKVPQVERFAA